MIGMMAPSPGQGQPNALVQVLPLLLIFVIFYFLLIRPARNRQKSIQKMLDALKNGDKVITTGGILGTVVGIDRNIVQLRIADKIKIDVTRSAIVGLQDEAMSSASSGS